jgi:hypothetical protein
MAVSPTDPNQFVSCIKIEGRRPRDIYVLLVSTNEERSIHYSRIFVYKNFPDQTPEQVLSVEDWIVDFTFGSDEEIIAITANGAVYIENDGEFKHERITNTPLFKLSQAFGDRTVAAGFDGVAFLYRRGEWRDISMKKPVNLYAVTVVGAKETYVGGGNGFLGYHDGQNWTEIESSTNNNFNTASVEPSGRVVVAGEKGTVIAGTAADGFEILDCKEFDIFGSCMYKGNLLLSAPGYGLFKIIGNSITDFQKGPQAYRISSNENYLYLAEDDCILIHDGSNWPQLPIF